MAPRIVSWGDNENWISPVPSSAASIVSFDPTFSDTYASYPAKMSPTNSEAPGLHIADLRAKHTSFTGISEGRGTSRGGHATPNDSFVRHSAYFFKDGNVTFLVDGTLYCVHRYFFSRDSIYFSTRFAKLGIRDHEAVPTIISIGDIERNDFETFLSILYPINFEAHELTYEQWKSVLDLSTRWGFATLRKLALKSIKPPTPHDQLILARTYSVEHWVLPALTALCERTLPLSLEEARQMSMEDVILVATVREEVRDGALRVDMADIPHHVKVALAGNLNRPMGNDVDWNDPKSGITGQYLDSAMALGVSTNVKVDDAKTIEVGSKEEKREKRKKKTIEVVSPLGDTFTDSAPVSISAESTRAQETAPSEVVADFKPSKDLGSALAPPAPSHALLPSLSPAPSPDPTDATPVPPIPEKDPTLEKISTITVTKERTLTSELAASAAAKTNDELGTPNTPGGKYAKENPTQTETPPVAAQDSGLKPGEAATEPTLWPSQNTEASGKETHKGDDSKLEGPVTPTLRLDPIREATTASTMFASSPGMLAGEATSKYDEAPGTMLSKGQRRRLKEKAKKQAHAPKCEENSPHPPFGATPNSVDNSAVQEPKPVAPAPVDIPAGEGEGVLVDVKMESDEVAPMVVGKPDAVATVAQTAADDAVDYDEWDMHYDSRIGFLFSLLALVFVYEIFFSGQCNITGLRSRMPPCLLSQRSQPSSIDPSLYAGLIAAHLLSRILCSLHSICPIRYLSCSEPLHPCSNTLTLAAFRRGSLPTEFQTKPGVVRGVYWETMSQEIEHSRGRDIITERS